jgi:hypothetical protein
VAHRAFRDLTVRLRADDQHSLCSGRIRLPLGRSRSSLILRDSAE